MELTQDKYAGQFRIQAYQTGRLTINNQIYDKLSYSSILLLPESLLAPWGPASVANLSQDDFQMVLDSLPQVLILGTGDQLIFPIRQVFEGLEQARIGVEVMDTRAACRSYVLLTSEGRRVALGLFL